MRILLPVISFSYLTGSEMYVYELGRELVRRGHDVTVATCVMGGALSEPARVAGIKVHKLGDPRTVAAGFDIIHASEPHPTEWALAAHRKTPIICTIHSQYDCEHPVIDPRILHYVCIRPEVQYKIVHQDRIHRSLTSVIYNPVDMQRFYPIVQEPREKKRILFCGTMDALRKASIVDLMNRSKAEGFQLWLLGVKAHNYAQAGSYLNNAPAGVTWLDQTWHAEKYIHQCDETAGILLGRTTIEGWACGKPGWIYDIDLEGRILSRELHQPPADMAKFDARNVVDQLEQLYLRYRLS